MPEPIVLPPMRGVETIRRALIGFLPTVVPQMVDAARMRWAQTDYELPYPVRYDFYNSSVDAVFPYVAVAGTDDRNFIRTDITDMAAQEYGGTYAMRIMVIARTPIGPDDEWLGELIPELNIPDTRGQAMRLCSDLTALVRGALLHTPSLNTPNIRMEESTLTTQYQEPWAATNVGQRWIAASVMAADFVCQEYTYALPAGVAETITTTVGVLNP